MARQFFRAAVDDKLIDDNPFAKAGSATVKGNRSQDYFVSRSEADAVLDACPDLQWRLLFALCRYGGLRCPSEYLRLRWDDIDWECGRMILHSPKTEHHNGGECRIVPIFPELRPLLEAAFDEARDGTQYVIHRYRNKNSNLRTQLLKIIKRAGLKPWPKLFHNLRASRQTELAEHFPSHVVCEWIGNSKAIAHEHYLQVTEAHYESAAYALQSGAESGGIGGNDKTKNAENPEKTGHSASDDCEESGRGWTRTSDLSFIRAAL